jgi:hypothetical protein
LQKGQGVRGVFGDDFGVTAFTMTEKYRRDAAKNEAPIVAMPQQSTRAFVNLGPSMSQKL